MYTTSDHVRDDLNGKFESTLSVSRAVLRHKGKYQCNINHDNAHFLHVHPAPVSIENDESFDAFEAENDHDDQRTDFERPDESEKQIRFKRPLEDDKTTSFSFEQPIEDDKPTPTTMMIFTSFVTESKKFVSPNIESILDYEDEKSHEKFIDEPTIFDGSGSLEYDSTVQVLTTTSSPSLTNIPLHPTHANHVPHTTHEEPSEVKTQIHLDKHRHKGSQKWQKWFEEVLDFYLLRFMIFFQSPFILISCQVSKYLVISISFLILWFVCFVSISYWFTGLIINYVTTKSLRLHKNLLKCMTEFMIVPSFAQTLIAFLNHESFECFPAWVVLERLLHFRFSRNWLNVTR